MMDTITIGVKNSTLFVKRGALFTGSTYTIAYEGIADANVRLRLYAVRSTIENAICVAEATDTTLAMTSSTWHEVFEANGYRELMTLKAYLYNADGDIVASGDVQVRMSPTKGTYGGKPVDVVGPKGPKGDKGDPGDKGDKGDSLFDVALEGGYGGSEEEWVGEIRSVAGHAKDAANAARMAEASKSSAKSYSDNANTYASNARTAASDAQSASTRAVAARIATENAASGAAQAKDDAVTAKGEAETAKGQAEGFAKDASTSASNASKSATASATSAQEAKQYAESGSDALNARLLREKVGLSIAEYQAEVGDSPSIVNVVPAPKGAIVYSNACAKLVWLHDGTFTETEFLRSTLNMSGDILLKWWDGNSAYAVYKGTDGATKKATITFVNDEPNALEVQTLSEIDVATITEALYCYAEGDFIVTSKGQVFNSSTLAFIGSFTEPIHERLSPKHTDGYFYFLTVGTSWNRMSRLKLEANGTPTFSTYGDACSKSLTPLMVGIMNNIMMVKDASSSQPAVKDTYAKGLYLCDNSAGYTAQNLTVECIASIYIPKPVYIGYSSLTYIRSKSICPFVRQVWCSEGVEFPWSSRISNTTRFTTRTGDGRYYFIFVKFNVRTGLYVREFTEVQ
jgi:hypothetical protein